MTPMTSTPNRRPRWEHGTLAGYNRHRCRCDECRTAWTEHQRSRRAVYRQRLEAGADVPHGRASTYGNWGCRSDPCRKAFLATLR
jgi:hypothetical protein